MIKFFTLILFFTRKLLCCSAPWVKVYKKSKENKLNPCEMDAERAGAALPQGMPAELSSAIKYENAITRLLSVWVSVYECAKRKRINSCTTRVRAVQSKSLTSRHIVKC